MKKSTRLRRLFARTRRRGMKGAKWYSKEPEKEPSRQGRVQGRLRGRDKRAEVDAQKLRTDGMAIRDKVVGIYRTCPCKSWQDREFSKGC